MIKRFLPFALVLGCCFLFGPATALSATACKNDKQCTSGQICVKSKCVTDPASHSVDPTEDELKAVGLDPNATSLDPRKSNAPPPSAPATKAPSSSAGSSSNSSGGSSSPKILRPSKSNAPKATSSETSSTSSTSTSSSSSSSSSHDGLGVSGQTFLIQDKVTGGIRFSAIGDTLGFQVSFNLLYTTDENPSRVLDGSFVAGMFGVHLLGNAFEFMGLQLRGGFGADIFGIWGVKADKIEVGLPILAELNYEAVNGVSFFLQPRFYIFTTDGLEPGTARNGDSYVPILFTTGIEFAL